MKRDIDVFACNGLFYASRKVIGHIMFDFLV